jgi:hypothetical protein
MCSSYYSSSIAQEDQKIFGRPAQGEVLSSQQKQQALQKILEYLPEVEEIYFAGGEPLIMPEHYAILQRLIQIRHTDLRIFYNTNLTKLSYKNFDVLDLWQRFKDITVGASVDAQGAVAEYVRHGCTWKDVENNLSLVKKECPHVSIKIHSTVGCLNVGSLIDLQKVWISSGFLPSDCFKLSHLATPLHLSLTALPLHHKNRLTDEIQSHMRWCHDNSAKTLADRWQNIVEYMWSSHHGHALDNFRRLIPLIDIHRKESLRDTLPELADLL